jgi:CRP/FNR family transcriptional regulator, cyclic AMP receptor protein
MPHATADDLAGIALFEELDPEARTAIAPWFEVQDVSPGVKLTGEGAAGYSFFVLRSGSATVTINGIQVRALGAGDFFGELAILGDGRRTATVTTDSPSQVLVLFGTEFRQLQKEHPEIAEQIESALRQAAQAA